MFLQGNLVVTSDERKVVVTAAVDGRKLQGMTTKRGSFNLQEPTQEYTSLLIAPDNSVTFYCSTTSPWFDCKWKHPSHKDPCGIFHTDQNKICHFTSPNGGKWTATKESSNRCSITGDRIDVTEAGEWDCALDSFPVEGTIGHSEYIPVQAYFRIKSLSQALVNPNQLPQQTKVFDGDTIELEVKVDNSDANPKPEFYWFLQGSLD